MSLIYSDCISVFSGVMITDIIFPAVMGVIGWLISDLFVILNNILKG